MATVIEYLNNPTQHWACNVGDMLTREMDVLGIKGIDRFRVRVSIPRDGKIDMADIRRQIVESCTPSKPGPPASEADVKAITDLIMDQMREATRRAFAELQRDDI